MNNNPFTLAFGKKPLQYVSRIVQTDQIVEDYVADPVTNQIYMVTGVRGSGKTVMMTNIAGILSERNDWIVVELNATRDLLQSLASKLYAVPKLHECFLKARLDFSAFGLGVTIENAAPVTDVEDMVAKMLVIDAGHGGEDSGAVANSVLEKDINLEIALKLRDMLKASGIEVKMIRESDVSIYDTASGTIRERKVSDLKNRVKIVNNNKKNILVSIHQNKFEQSKYSGAQMFYSANNDKSQILAENIRKSITGLIQPENKRELKKGGSDIYLLNKATVPAVIVECGFISNEEEAKNLSNEEYQSKMAFAICCGILEYKNKN